MEQLSFFYGWLHGVMVPRWSSRNFDSIWLSFTLFILQYHTMLLFFANFARSRILLYFHFISQRRNISNFLNFGLYHVNHIQGVPKKCTNRTKAEPKLSSMGLNFIIDMTFQTQGVPATCDWASALWLQQHSESTFFWDTLYFLNAFQAGSPPWPPGPLGTNWTT